MTVQHVALEVRQADVDAEVAFWSLLGFDRVAPPPSLAERATWVQSGPTQVHLLYADAPVIPATGHVAVVCPHFEATTTALTSAGHPVDPRRPHWGSPRAYTTSPAGHRIEVMAWPPTEQR